MNVLRLLAYAYARSLAQRGPRPPHVYLDPRVGRQAAWDALPRWRSLAATALADAGDGGLRASDAEREQVATFLKRHCAEGRLSTDELSARVEAAYRAGSLRQLVALTHDLPGSPFPVAVPPEPRRRPRPVARLAVLALGIGAFLALASLVPAELWVQLIALTIPFVAIAVFGLMPLLLPLLFAIFAFRSFTRPGPWVSPDPFGRPRRGAGGTRVRVWHP